MSKADEIFKELGYKKKELGFEFTEYIQKENEVTDLVISFDATSRTIMCGLFEKGITHSRALAINCKELQAINEKCKELGWLYE
jgi:hypothetical protein